MLGIAYKFHYPWYDITLGIACKLHYPWFDITLGIAYSERSQLPVVYHTGYNLQVSVTWEMISRWVLPTSLRYPWYDITLGIAYKSQIPVV